MPLPPGFVLDETPDRVSAPPPRLPEGFVLDTPQQQTQKTPNLPPGFILDSPVQSMNRTPTPSTPRVPIQMPELENPWMAQAIGSLSDPAQAAWEKVKQGIGWPVEKLTQGINFVGNLPSELSNKLRGQAPGMLGYVPPAFGEKAEGPNLELLPRLREPWEEEEDRLRQELHKNDNVSKAGGHVEQSNTVGAGFNPVLGMPVLGTPVESKYVRGDDDEQMTLGKAYPGLFAGTGGAYDKAAEMVNTLFSRQSALSLPFGGSKIALAAFLAPMVAELPEKTIQSGKTLMDPNATPAEKGGAVAEPLVDALMLYGGKKGLETTPAYGKPAEVGTRQPSPNVRAAEGKPFSMMDRLNTGINPDEMAKILVPAVRIGGRLVMGKQGDTHADIIKREGGDPKLKPHEDPDRVFANPNTGEVFNRVEAKKVTNLPGNAWDGGLDSQDLPGAQLKKIQESTKPSEEDTIRYKQVDALREEIKKRLSVIDPKTSEYTELSKQLGKVNAERNALIEKYQPKKEVWKGTPGIDYTQFASRGGKPQGGGSKLHSGIPLPELLDDIEKYKKIRLAFHNARELRPEDDADRGKAMLKSMNSLQAIERKYGGKKPEEYYREERGLDRSSSLYSGLDLSEEVKKLSAIRPVVGSKRVWLSTKQGSDTLNSLVKDTDRVIDAFSGSGIMSRASKELKPGVKTIENEVNPQLFRGLNKLKGDETIRQQAIELAQKLDKFQKSADDVSARKLLQDFPDEDVAQLVAIQGQKFARTARPLSSFQFQFPRTVLPSFSDRLAAWTKTVGKLTSKDAYELINKETRPGDLVIADTDYWGPKTYQEQGGAKTETQAVEEAKRIIDTVKAKNAKLLYFNRYSKSLEDLFKQEGFETQRNVNLSKEFGTLIAHSNVEKAPSSIRFQSGIDLNSLFPGKKTDFDYKQILSFVGARKGESAPEWLKSAKVTREAKYEGYAAGKGIYQQLKQQSDPYFDPQSNWFRHHPDQPGVVFHKQTGKPYFAMIKPELKGESFIVDGKPATAEQIAEIKKFQKEKEAGGTDFRVFDMDKAEVEKGGKIEEFKTEEGKTFGGEVYTNPLGYLLNKFEKRMSYDVDKSLKEVFETAMAKHGGVSAPFHATADTNLYKQGKLVNKQHDVVNALVGVASSDIFALAKAEEVGTTKDKFVKLFRNNAEKRLYNAYIDSDLGVVYKKGVKAPIIKGEPTLLVRVAGKSLWLRRDLVPEFKQAFKPNSKHMKAGVAALMDYVTHAQITGVTDAIYHGANMYASIAGLPMVSRNMAYNLLRAFPGVRHADTLVRITKGTWDGIFKTPEVKKELSRLAEIGAARPIEKYTWGLQHAISELPSLQRGIRNLGWDKAIKRIDETGMSHVIRVIDRGGRLARSRIFDELVKAKIYKDTEFSRREFVNKMGQYNSRLMTEAEAWMKEYTAQFIVAGKTFNRNSLNRVFLRPEAEVVNKAAYWKYKAMAAWSTYVGLLGSTWALNYMFNGNIWGRPNKHIPPGKIDFGKDDEKTGQPIMFDLMQLTGDRRAFRGMGGQALEKGEREEEKSGEMVKHIGRDIFDFLAHPYEGPPVRLGINIYEQLHDKTKKDFDWKEFASQINPHIAQILKAKEEMASDTSGEKKSLLKETIKAVGEQAGSAAGLQKGQRPSRAEQVETFTGKPEGKATLDDRLTAEKKYTESRGPLSSKQKLAGQERALQNIEETRKDISDIMPKSSQDWAKSKALDFPGVDRHIQYKGGKVTLTKQEITRYELLTAEEYKRVLPSVQKSYDKMPSAAQKKYFSEVMSAAKLRARQKLIEEIKSGSIAEQDKKKKRFSVFEPEN